MPPTDAATLLLGPVLPVFVDRYPDVQIDISVTNRLVDVIDGGFDAGIRYGGTVPEDMVAQRLSADIGWVVAGTPAYPKRFGTPKYPDDLKKHRCLASGLAMNVCIAGSSNAARRRSTWTCPAH